MIRAKSGQVAIAANEIMAITRNLTSGYHRDFQLLKEPLFRAIDTTVDCLGMTTYMLQNLSVKDNLLENPNYSVVYSVDAVARYVQDGISFRDAYVRVGKELEAGAKLEDLTTKTTHIGSLDNLGIDLIREKLKI